VSTKLGAIHFGPVAPSDEDYFGDEFYWLAEVEWLEDLDLSLPLVHKLKNLLSTLTDDEPVQQQGIPDFVSRCNAALTQAPDFAPLINTLLKAAEEVRSGGCDIDANITNVMLRPSSGLLVWSDPLFGTYGYLDDQDEARMVDLRQMIKSQPHRLNSGRQHQLPATGCMAQQQLPGDDRLRNRDRHECQWQICGND
jgi:hypothetical protein